MIKVAVSDYLKTGLMACLVLLCSVVATAQDKAPASPPATASAKVGATEITIKYSSPSVKGRKIFGEMEPFGKVWRAGANDATTITFSKDVTIEGQPLKAGTYAFFTIPDQDEWTVIFNKTAKQWGAFKYDQAQDALRVKVKPTTSKEVTERLKYEIKPQGKNTAVITLSWEKAVIPFTVKTATGV